MEVLRVFPDTNVIFSIAYSGAERSRGYLLYELQAKGLIRVFFSGLVCEEALLNLGNKKPEALPLLHELIARSTVLPDLTLDSPSQEIASLPLNDRLIFSCAIRFRMDHFLTGNTRDFGRLMGKIIAQTTVLTPRDCLNRRS